MKIACCQVAPNVEAPQDNIALTTRAIRDATDAGAEVVVVPELATSGYVFRSEDEARAAAISPDQLEAWAAEAARTDAIVIGGFAELAPDGQVFNSAALVDREGVRAVYRKLHLWHEETRWFSPGGAPAPVIETPHGRIGLAVCYDIEFPELTRGLALRGAELIVIPANWPRDDDPPDGRPVLYPLTSMTAYLNKVFVAVCDRHGTERGGEFEGASVIAGPTGAILAASFENRGAITLHAELDLSQARDKRTSDENDAFTDRRAEHYEEALIEPARPPTKTT